jgi:hypothetical protein
MTLEAAGAARTRPPGAETAPSAVWPGAAASVDRARRPSARRAVQAAETAVAHALACRRVARAAEAAALRSPVPLSLRWSSLVVQGGRRQPASRLSVRFEFGSGHSNFAAASVLVRGSRVALDRGLEAGAGGGAEVDDEEGGLRPPLRREPAPAAGGFAAGGFAAAPAAGPASEAPAATADGPVFAGPAAATLPQAVLQRRILESANEVAWGRLASHAEMLLLERRGSSDGSGTHMLASVRRAVERWPAQRRLRVSLGDGRWAEYGLTVEGIAVEGPESPSAERSVLRVAAPGTVWEDARALWPRGSADGPAAAATGDLFDCFRESLTELLRKAR